MRRGGGERHELVGWAWIRRDRPRHRSPPGPADALLDRRGRPAPTGYWRDLDRLARALHVQERGSRRSGRLGGRTFEVGHGEVMRDDPDDPYPHVHPPGDRRRGAARGVDDADAASSAAGGRSTAAAGYAGG